MTLSDSKFSLKTLQSLPSLTPHSARLLSFSLFCSNSIAAVFLLAFLLLSLPFFIDSAQAQVANRPIMDERLQNGYRLSTQTESILAPKRVIALADAETNRLLGSATRICLETNHSSKSYYVTGYHVIDSKPAIRQQNGGYLQIEMVDSLMDLALLSGEKSSDPCLPLAPFLFIGSTFDLENASHATLYSVQIEALDMRAAQPTPQARRLMTVFVATHSFGMSAHSLTGPLIAINALGVPGMSGGAVSAWIERGRLLQYHNPVFTSDPAVRRSFGQEEYLVGLIKAVDAEGRQMLLVPGPSITARIQLFLSNPTRFGNRITDRNRGDRTELIESGAVLLSGTNLFNSSTALINAGTAGRSDGGTAGRSDGTAVSNLSSALAGIVHPSFPDRLWLSLDQGWTEFETLLPNTRSLLSRPDQMRGVYSVAEPSSSGQERILYATSISTPIPNWFLDFTTLSHSGREGVDLSLQERSGSFMSQAPMPPCITTLATLRKIGDEDLHGALVAICEWPNESGGRSLGLLLASQNQAFRPMLIRVDVKKKCVSGSTPCPLSIDARLHELNSFPFHQRNNWLQHAMAISAQHGTDRGQVLRTIGMRRFYSDRVSLLIERTGGYRIQLKNWLGSSLISGPSEDILSTVNPYLESGEAMHRILADSFPQAQPERRATRPGRAVTPRNATGAERPRR